MKHAINMGWLPHPNGGYNFQSLYEYRYTIASSPPEERIFFFFEKLRFASQKLNFSIFVF